LLEPLADEKHPGYQLSLASVYCNAGDILKNTGKTAEALKWLTQAVELAETVLQKEPQLAVAVERAYNAHGTRAQVHELLGRWAEAAEDWDRVEALERGSNAWKWRLFQAVALARSGQHVRAAAGAKALEKEPQALAGVPYDLACVYALATAAALKDAKLSTAEPTGLAERYAQQRPEAGNAHSPIQAKAGELDAQRRDIPHDQPAIT
jgi:tetratricopeptide (TPR) repeat protein